MLIIWFVDGSIKSKLILESSLQFINILIKARAGIAQDMACREAIYQILANDNPEEYPLDEDKNPISTYSFIDGDCTFNDTVCSDPFEKPPCEESPERIQTMRFEDCDCSDPKKYNFEDQGRFKIK